MNPPTPQGQATLLYIIPFPSSQVFLKKKI